MAATFVQAVDGLTLPLEPLKLFCRRRNFAEFYGSSFPVFAIGSTVSHSDLKEAARTINEQVKTELGFNETELAEMGYAAAVPVDENDTSVRSHAAAVLFNERDSKEVGHAAAVPLNETESADRENAASVPQVWEMHEMTPADAVRWYHEQFDKKRTSDTDDPQWYPLGFLGICSPDWKETGAVMVFYDVWHEHLERDDDDIVGVRAYKVHPKKIGPALISLRQGDDDFENVKRESRML